MPRIIDQEIFGPVAPVTTFSTEAEAIAAGQRHASTAWPPTSTAATSTGAARRRTLEFGMVGFNAGVVSNAAAPFGGVKQSGLGREGGSEGIAEYTTTQYIGIADPWADHAN